MRRRAAPSTRSERRLASQRSQLRRLRLGDPQVAGAPGGAQRLRRAASAGWRASAASLGACAWGILKLPGPLARVLPRQGSAVKLNSWTCCEPVDRQVTGGASIRSVLSAGFAPPMYAAIRPVGGVRTTNCTLFVPP